MADSVWGSTSASAVPATTVRPRHCAVVRATHWITTLCFLALLVSGVEILISHPRFYWGEAGNVLTPDPSLQSHRPHRLRLRASRPERLEPLSPFPIRLGLCINRLTLCRLRIVPRAFPAEFASRSRRSLLEGALDRNRPTFAPQAGE